MTSSGKGKRVSPTKGSHFWRPYHGKYMIAIYRVLPGAGEWLAYVGNNSNELALDILGLNKSELRHYLSTPEGARRWRRLTLWLRAWISRAWRYKTKGIPAGGWKVPDVRSRCAGWWREPGSLSPVCVRKDIFKIYFIEAEGKKNPEVL